MLSNVSAIRLDDPVSEHALDERARRAARRVGLIARKSRWRRGSSDNFGRFMLIEPYANLILGGERFNTPRM